MVKVRKEIKWNIYWKLKATWNYYRKWNRLKEEVECLKCWYVHYVDRPCLITNRCWCRKCSHHKHWLAYSRFYQIWKDLTQRVNNKKTPSYSIYGGRWIKCLWNNFEEFKNDMYESYENHVKEFWEKETTIDRIDVNGNYCKDNCRRATNLEQANNTRKTTWIAKFARDNWIQYGKVLYRYYSKWLSLEQIKEKFT